MVAAKRALPTSPSQNSGPLSPVKRPRLGADPESRSTTDSWFGLGTFKSSWDWMMGRRKPKRPNPQVRRANGTSAVGLQLSLPDKRGVFAIPNGYSASQPVIELSDDEGVDFERDIRWKRQTSEARKHLNDLERDYREDHSLNGPSVVHQHLFPSAFNPPVPSAALEPSSPTPSVDVNVPKRPDVAHKRPGRNYSFVRSRSSSGNLSVSSGTSSPPRTPRRTARTSMRNGADEERQFVWLNKVIERSPESSAPLLRVKQELLLNRQQSHGHHSERAGSRSADLVKAITELKLDGRKTLDEAVRPKREEFQPPPVHRKPQSRPSAPLGHVKSNVLEKFKREKEESEKRIAARLQPHAPQDVTPEQNKIVQQRLADPMFKSETVDAKALRTLKPGVWLNDEIINFYVDALRARAEKEGKNIAVGNSFFYQKLSEQGYSGVKRWGRTRKIPEKDLFVIPVHVQGCHWTCACINFKKKRIEYYDSMTDSGFRFGVFENLRDYLREEWKTRLNKDFDFTGWEDVYNKRTPQQNNGSDCGVFACQTMESLARGKDLVKGQFEFNSANMSFFRKLMVVEIASGELAQRVWANL